LKCDATRENPGCIHIAGPPQHQDCLADSEVKALAMTYLEEGRSAVTTTWCQPSSLRRFFSWANGRTRQSFSSSRAPTAGSGSLARVLVGAPLAAALTSPHRPMPVLIPAVVPLVSTNQADQPRHHGGPLPRDITLLARTLGCIHIRTAPQRDRLANHRRDQDWRNPPPAQQVAKLIGAWTAPVVMTIPTRAVASQFSPLVRDSFGGEGVPALHRLRVHVLPTSDFPMAGQGY